MGTNFYTKLNECESCGRYNEIHLGKSSYGWQFSFQYNGGLFYKNISEMKKWLKGRTIENEYGEIIKYDEFWKMVKAKQKKEFQNHAQSYPDSTYELVIGGYSFSDCNFS